MRKAYQRGYKASNERGHVVNNYQIELKKLTHELFPGWPYPFKEAKVAQLRTELNSSTEYAKTLLKISLITLSLSSCFIHPATDDHMRHKYYDIKTVYIDGEIRYIFGCERESCTNYRDTFLPIHIRR